MKYLDTKKDRRRVFRLILRDGGVRLDLSLAFGILMNLVYITVNLISAVRYKSLWSYALTLYYFLFVAARVYLIGARDIEELKGENKVAVWSIALRMGVFLLVIDLAVAAVMLHTVKSESFARYSGGVLFGFLVYTVYSLGTSLYGMKRHLRDGKELSAVARTMTLTASLVSAFNLQYSLLLTVGIEEGYLDVANTLSALSVFTVITLLALRVILKSVFRLCRART